MVPTAGRKLWSPSLTEGIDAPRVSPETHARREEVPKARRTGSYRLG